MELPYKSYLKFTFFICLFINTFLLAQKPVGENQVLATIGIHKIIVKDFAKRYGDYLFSTGIKDNIVIRRAILNNMINEISLYYYDDNKKIFADPEFKKEINWADRQTILAYLEDQEVFAKIKITDAELREAFFRSNEKLAARHLYAATEKEADNLYQLLQAGADFNTLAKQVFTDSTLQKNGGYLGYFSWGDMDPAFEDAAYSMKVGEISKPVKTKTGYSIIKLEDRVPNPMITENEFINKRHHMEEVLRLRKREPSEKAFIDKHFKPEKVWFNEKLLSNIWDNLRYSTVNSPEQYKPKFSNAVCVKFGSKNYTQNEMEKRIDDIPIFHKDKLSSLENLKTVIAGLVLQDILYKLAVDKGYDTCRAVQNILPKYHNVIFLEFKRKEISDNAVIPDSVVKKFYRDNPQYFTNPDQINVQEILVKSKTLADSLITLINKGSDFGSLAEKFSIRDWSAKNKGVMGFAEVSKFGMLKDTLWKAQTGKIIGPEKIQNIFGIFKVLEKKPGEVKKLDEVKDVALRLTKVEKSKQLVDDYIEKIKPKVKIFADDITLGSIVVNN